MTTPECPSCHATDGRPHTEYCRGAALDHAVAAAARVAYEREWSDPPWDDLKPARREAYCQEARYVLAAAIPVLLDAVTVQAREHVAAGRGHMTWAETLTQLRRMTEIATEESP